MRGMAGPEKENDIERLIREADDAISGRSSTARSRSEVPAGTRSGSRVSAVQVAAASAAIAAATVFVLFALIPFLGSVAGAAGAFLGTFVAVLVLRWR